MSEPAVPISPEEFAALMQPLEPFGSERRLVVAVSGGADSMALALLLSRWGRPRAAIVDHGLRAESAEEAAATATRLAGLGIPARIARASLAAGPAQSERARVARYGLLFAICREAGLPDLAVAHHAGDQSETIRMRLDAGSGALGLGGMVASSFRNEARLIRPLLGVDPARLRATLRQASVPWVEDPGNCDPRTARGLLRATMGAAERVAALAVADHGAKERQAILREVAAELASVWLAPEGFAVIPDRLGPHALSALLWTISGRRYPPPRASLARGLTPRTVAGVLLRPAGRLGSGVLVTREPAAVQAPIAACDGAVWDGRFRLHGTVPAGVSLGALGADAPAFRRLSPLPAAVLATLPALRREDALVAVPHLAFPRARLCPSVQIDFWPGRPATSAPGSSKR
ncbi:MAG: tRNA lysidine(34) synthetase TilS [Acetobacteraceae bacterium]|nr:tRNA lysidine(34) synthetase TilS [Acetobacteraceae bacterium]